MLDQVEGAFISGTSPKVLPIASIDKRVLEPAKYSLVPAIMKEYDNVLKHYINEHK
jgi:branched-chain amino acid aminotransferase